MVNCHNKGDRTKFFLDLEGLDIDEASLKIKDEFDDLGLDSKS
jgi:DNA primase